MEGAGRFFSESQVSYERLGIVGTLGYAGAAIGLGRVALARGDLVEAESRFRETLAARACTAWEKMDAITGMAEAMARSGDISRAIELLAFVAEHSFASAATRERVGVLLQELAVELPADVFAAAKARGRALRLENIVAELFGMDGMKGTA
jgi:thioredoxin-like negative regulator of GroEL